MIAPRRLGSRFAVGLAALYALDRAAKLLALGALLRRPTPTPPAVWPPVTMLHPITTTIGGRSPLATNLRACARLEYPAPRRHILICDAGATDTLATCRAFLAAHPALDAALVIVPREDGPVASKIVKLLAGLAHAAPCPDEDAAVLCFIDDDIAPRPDSLRGLVAALGEGTDRIGAVFGLSCYTNWRGPWSSLLSELNNANVPGASAALTHLAPPPRMVGHLVAYRWRLFARAGGLDGLADQIDDDFAFARRLRAIGAAIVQTPVVYDVDNDLASWPAFARQLRRWFVLPRQAMVGALSGREATAGIVVSLGVLLPPLVALLAALARRRTATMALGVTLLAYLLSARANERLLQNPAPRPCGRLWMHPLVVCALPVGTLAAALFADDEVEWRGQRLKIAPGGRFERLT